MKRIQISEQQAIGYSTNGPITTTALVLLHGFCEDSSVWDKMWPLLDGIPVIRMDLPGFGASDLAAHPGTDVYADSIFNALQLLGVQKCMLVGHSLGGYIALEYMNRHPEHLSAVSLFHSHPYPDNEERIIVRRRGIEMLRQGKRDLYVSQLFPGLFAPTFAAEHPEIIQKMIEMGKKQHPEGIIAALETMISRPAFLQTLEQASCPVQFLLGSADALIPLDGALRAAALPAVCDLHIIPGVGHMGMWEAPEVCAGFLLNEYLRI